MGIFDNFRKGMIDPENADAWDNKGTALDNLGKH